MHRWSQLFIPTLREAPTDAEVASHKLLLRAGYIRQLGAGIYSYLFLGNRSVNKIIAIVREEMDKIGQEFLLPALNPREIWDESGRWSVMGDNMFRLKDRKGAELCLAMTHEEIMTSIARNELRSYKQLPQIWYQIQTKFRDEPRPKSGLLRVRQFIMKDAYSFDIDEAGLDESYRKHDEAYRRIFARCGLQFLAVDADSGAMGGSASQEFMVYTDAGEDLIASSSSGYAANLEKATSVLIPIEDLAPTTDAPELIHTPGYRTIEEVGAFLTANHTFALSSRSSAESGAILQPHHQLKTMAYIADLPVSDHAKLGKSRPVVVFLRGDHSLNEAKLAAIAGGELRPMTPEELLATFNTPAGYLGPIGLEAAPHPKKPGTLVILDKALEGRTNLVAGANKEEYHLRNVTPLRDFKPTLIADVRNINEGELDPIGQQPLRLGKAVEIGHIFKLGYKYTKSMGASVLNRDGKEVTPIMGSYGIGIERILTAAIESSAAANNGEAYALSPNIAPFQVVVTITNIKDESLLAAGEKIAADLTAAGLDVLLDDRDERAGVKFKDADLTGIPYRINIGRGVAEGKVEFLDRLTGQSHDLNLDSTVQHLKEHHRLMQHRHTLTLYASQAQIQQRTHRHREEAAAHPLRRASPLHRYPRHPCLHRGLCHHLHHRLLPLPARSRRPPRLRPHLRQHLPDLRRPPRGPHRPEALRRRHRPRPQPGRLQRQLPTRHLQTHRATASFIKPGPESYHTTDGATIDTTGETVQSITAENGATLSAYELEPQLITSLSEDKNRTKRRLVAYNDIPPRLVQAVTAIEDRDFFSHGGINYLRTAKCAVQDVLSGHYNCGGSTLTQQLAKNLFLSPEKHWRRKAIEIMITFQLEHRFTKQQIFEMYANEMNIGHIGSYEINGFGEAAQTFFNKPMGQLDTAQCALLAGLLQNPSFRNPYRHPDRAMARRNIVLDSMVETGAITEAEATRAKAEPLRLAPPNIDASEAPYFVDLVHDQIVQRIGDQDAAHQNLRIYTSLDPELQRAAAEAVETGIKNVDEIVRRQHGKKPGPINYPQVALVAINPHTGQLLALVGGRDYSASQLDHALAKRPTGSIFKPFVYAAAYNTSLNGTTLGDGRVFTALTPLNDDTTTFTFDNGRQSYTPGNFDRNEYPGMVIAADAIAHSLNIATIALAQQVGFDNVAALARTAGITEARGTPSVAIGTYSATPIDMAGAYTVFANSGVHINPWMLASVRSANGDVVADYSPQAKQVLDPRTAYLTQTLMEGVMTYGTGSTVRLRGFTAPAAGKTGTSHDAWFAGYTSNLLCVIWVGNDDYTDIKIEGAKAAAPIWAEFMKRATQLPQYSDVKSFSAPEGVTNVRIDRTTDLRADDSCPGKSFYTAFLDGTAPLNSCAHMNESPQNIFQKIFGIGGSKPTTPPPPTTPASPAPITRVVPVAPANTPESTAPPAPQKKKNIFQKIFGGGGDKNKKQPDQQPPQ